MSVFSLDARFLSFNNSLESTYIILLNEGVKGKVYIKDLRNKSRFVYIFAAIITRIYDMSTLFVYITLAEEFLSKGDHLSSLDILIKMCNYDDKLTQLASTSHEENCSLTNA